MASSEPAPAGASVPRPDGAIPPGSISGEQLRSELALATHDVNNAFNTVLVGSHLLQLSAADPEAVRRHTDRIAQAARQGVAAAARMAALLRAASAAAPTSDTSASDPTP
jgi:hypothetical protein